MHWNVMAFMCHGPFALSLIYICWSLKAKALLICLKSDLATIRIKGVGAFQTMKTTLSLSSSVPNLSVLWKDSFYLKEKESFECFFRHALCIKSFSFKNACHNIFVYSRMNYHSDFANELEPCWNSFDPEFHE